MADPVLGVTQTSCLIRSLTHSAILLSRASNTLPDQSVLPQHPLRIREIRIAGQICTLQVENSEIPFLSHVIVTLKKILTGCIVKKM